jgi:hypothetical protein
MREDGYCCATADDDNDDGPDALPWNLWAKIGDGPWELTGAYATRGEADVAAVDYATDRRHPTGVRVATLTSRAGVSPPPHETGDFWFRQLS